MKLGFHYHVPAYTSEDGVIFVPGFLGVFLDGLANECNILICFLHTPNNEMEKNFCDYKIKSPNVSLVNIGKHRNILFRNFLSFIYYPIFIKKLKLVDAVLIRGPTPLLPIISAICNKLNIPYSYLLVGDYLKSFKTAIVRNPVKKALLLIIYRMNTRLQNFYSYNAIRITNNPIILNELNSHFGKSYEIRTTTLNEESFNQRPKPKNKFNLKLFFAGRLEQGKGIDDIFQSIILLNDMGLKIELNIAGWDPTKNQTYLNFLKCECIRLGIEQQVNFLGKKSVGEDLLSCYRDADVFIVASKGNEGFPRTIWEAMSQKIPVVATKVGSIPEILKDRENVILVNQSSPKEICAAICELNDSIELTDKLVENGLRLAKENTIEAQSRRLMNILKENICVK